MNNELLFLGENIRRLRRNSKMSQEKLGEKCGLARTFLSDVERGRRNPSFLTLLAIARGLESTVSELTREMETDAPNTTKSHPFLTQPAQKTGESGDIVRPDAKTLRNAPAFSFSDDDAPGTGSKPDRLCCNPEMPGL